MRQSSTKPLGTVRLGEPTLLKVGKGEEEEEHFLLFIAT